MKPIPKPIKTILTPLTSLKLTVVLLAMSLVLIFAGTWAQIDRGIWSVMRDYFRSWGVWVPFQVFLPRDWDVWGGFPWPGGYVIGSLLLINLITAHTVRFKVSWQRSGILLIHTALIMLLVSEGVTAIWALETQMPIYEGQTTHWSHDIREVELAVIDHAHPQHDAVVAVPQTILETAAKTDELIRHEKLPFDIRVDRFMINSASPTRIPENGTVSPLATHGLGRTYAIREIPEASGVGQQTVNVPSALITLSKNGQTLGRYLVSLWFDYDDYKPLGQEVRVAGKTFEIYLRFRRYYKPYRMELIKFRHDLYPGTTIPKNFSSLVRLQDAGQNEDRQALIYMNHPLRYRGETLYQTNWIRGKRPGDPDRGTVLAIAQNPGWTIPYIACTMGALGMLIHFGMQLVSFLRRQAA